MLTSHCLHCGAPKTDYAADYCGGCTQVRNETREYVTQENNARAKANEAILTDENKKRLEDAARADFTGSAARELTQSLGLKPLIDMSAALHDAMLKRAHDVNGSRAHPRTLFNPGLTDARAGNLGMDSRVPPGRTLTPGGGA